MNPLLNLEAAARDEETEPQLADIIDAVRSEYETDLQDINHELRVLTWFQAACYHWQRLMTYNDSDCRSLAIVAVVLEKHGRDMIPAILSSLMPDTTLADMRGFLDISADIERADIPYDVIDAYAGSNDLLDIPSAMTMREAMRNLDCIIQNSADDVTANAHTVVAFLALASGDFDTARESARQADRIDPEHPFGAWLAEIQIAEPAVARILRTYGWEFDLDDNGIIIRVYDAKTDGNLVAVEAESGEPIQDAVCLAAEDHDPSTSDSHEREIANMLERLDNAFHNEL